MSVTRNPNLGPSHIRAKRRRLFLIRFLIVLFFLLVVVIALAIFSDHEKVRISSIVITGNAVVTGEEILTIVNRDLTGRYWHLFSKNNFLIFPRFTIKNDLLREIITIKDLNINWDNWNQISLSVSERKPHSVWCGDIMSTPETNCYFVDKNGYIYRPAVNFSGNIFIKNFGQLLNIENIESSGPLGWYFLSSSIYSRIFALINILEQNNLKITTVSYDGFDFKFVMANGPEIIFTMDITDLTGEDFSLPFANLFSAIETKNLDLTGEANTIKYLDLRFDNKIVIGRNPVE